MPEMKHIQNFNKFLTEGAMPDHRPEVFVFIRNRDEQFGGEVRKQSGGTVCTVDQKWLDDGRMQHETDLVGLKDVLVKRKKMTQVDELVSDAAYRIKPYNSSTAQMAVPVI